MSPNIDLDKYGSWLSCRINYLVLLWYGIARNILCRSIKFYDEPSQTKKNIRCQNLKKFKKISHTIYKQSYRTKKPMPQI